MELFRPLLDPYVLISLIKQCLMLQNIRQHNSVRMAEFNMDVPYSSPPAHRPFYYVTKVPGAVVTRCITDLT